MPAGHIEVAQAYVTIIPSLKGAQKTISKELTPAAAMAATDAGEKIDKGLSEAGESGAKKAGKSISETFSKSGAAVMKSFNSMSDRIAFKTQTSLTQKIAKVGEDIGSKFKGIGNKVGGYFSEALVPNDFAQSVASKFSKLTGTIRGVGTFVTSTLAGAATKAGSAFASIKDRIAEPLQAAAGVAGKAISGIGKVAGPVLSGIGNAAKSAFGALGTAAKAGAAAATAALAIVGKGALDAYADYEQLSGGVQKLFGEDVARTVTANAQAAYQTAGMSANQYMETVTSFSASLIAGLGGDTAKAAGYADTAVRDMADNANTFGTSMQSVQDAYQGFAKQNYVMLDNLKLGYGGTATEMARLVRDSGVLGDAAKDLTAENLNEKVSFDQIVKAIHVTQERMGIYGTTAAEAAHTISGSISSMQAAWQNWLIGLGDDEANVEELTDKLVDTAVTAAENVIPRLGTIVNRVVAAAPDAMRRIGSALTAQIVPMLDSVTSGAASKVIDMFGPAAQRIGTAIGTLTDSLAGLAPKAADSASAIGGLLADALEGAAGVFERLTPVVTSLVDGALTVLPGVLEFVGGAFSTLGGFVERVAGVFGGLAERLAPLAPVVSDIANKVGGLLAGALDVAATAMEWLEPIVASLAENLLPLLSGALDVVGNAFDAVGKFVQPVADVLGPVLADVVIPAVCDALGLLGGIIGGVVDGLSWLGDAFGSVVDLITGKNDEVADSARGMMSKTVGSYSDVANGVNVSMTKAGKSVTTYNKVNLKDKSATAKVNDKSLVAAQVSKQTWNKTDIRNKNGVGSVSGNLAQSVANKDAWNRTGLNSVWGKATIDAAVNATVALTGSGFGGSNGSGHYTLASGGSIPRHAAGFIAPHALTTSIGNHVGIIGEDGAEAVVGTKSATHVVPLTNKRYSQPFIDDVADGVAARDGSAALLAEVRALRNDLARLNLTLDGRVVAGYLSPYMDAAQSRHARLRGYA